MFSSMVDLKQGILRVGHSIVQMMLIVVALEIMVK
jgi:hypothetical protein